MKTILILGIGNAQLDAVRVCKEMGMIVHTCSNTNDGAAKEVSDYFKLIDIIDFEQVLKYTSENNIEAVYSVGSDIAMPTICYVSEKLNLPHFVSFKTAKICNSKDELRKALGDSFKGNLKYKVVSSINKDMQIDYPLIMKPVDSQGQRGVRVVKNYNELIKYFPSSLHFSRSKKIILEEYIEGPEISVNIYLLEGKIVFYFITDRITWPQFPGGIIHRHYAPTRIINKTIEKKVRKLVEQVLEILSISNGPVYFQIKLKEDEPKLIEITPRLDGCHLWRLLKYHTSVDLLEMSFKHLLSGNLSNIKTISNKDKEAYKLEFMCEYPDKAVDKNKYRIKNPLYTEWYYTNSEPVRSLNGFYEKIGYHIKKMK